MQLFPGILAFSFLKNHCVSNIFLGGATLFTYIFFSFSLYNFKANPPTGPPKMPASSATFNSPVFVILFRYSL